MRARTRETGIDEGQNRRGPERGKLGQMRARTRVSGTDEEIWDRTEEGQNRGGTE